MKHLQNKQRLLEELYEPYKKCLECPLGFLGRKTVVFGEGSPDAPIMFIGEGPGREEDETGRPFIGRSGKLLTRLLAIVGIKREDVFITSVVKCRPPANRKPSPVESMTCKNLLLLKQIEIIKPKILCTLGSTALEALTGGTVKISSLRGKEFKWEGYTVIPTFHPAYILRNPKETATMVDDLVKAAAAADIGI